VEGFPSFQSTLNGHKRRRDFTEEGMQFRPTFCLSLEENPCRPTTKPHCQLSILHRLRFIASKIALLRPALWPFAR
jgi:hypothetical protein